MDKGTNIEIERKFLVKADFRKDVFKSFRISQAYLNSDPRRTVRVRIKDEKAFITVKGENSGPSRFEWEKEISLSDAEALLAIAEQGVIDKIRHLVRNTDGRHIWEIDEFHGDNEGLVVAEIELESADEQFNRPEWLGKEVTGEARYYNSRLAVNPYKDWIKEK